MSIVKLRKDAAPLGNEMSDEGELRELGLDLYRGLDAAMVVRRALELGVSARETLTVLSSVGFDDVTLSEVIAARDITRQELAEEYAFSREEAKALILRRSDKAIHRLLHDLDGGNTRVAKDLTNLLKLQAEVYGVNRDTGDGESKLKDELARVSAEGKVAGATIPKTSGGQGDRMSAALEKYHQNQVGEDQNG